MAHVSDSFPGAKFGRLTVVSLGPPSRRRVAVCLCDCGQEREIEVSNLGGNSTTCGCAQKRHGHSSARNRTPTYSTWRAMLSRCLNKKTKEYPRYGGRGIAVCEWWLDFRNFLADMGERPKGTTIDRRDNDKGYSSDNCRWATAVEQIRNRRCTKLTSDIVREIVVGIHKETAASVLGPILGVHRNRIHSIRRAAEWADVVKACLDGVADHAIAQHTDATVRTWTRGRIGGGA